jgi:class 3 adenylate cyclase
MAAPGRLIAVLAAEVADGSRPIRAEKGGALEPQETHRDQLIYRKIAEHYGCILTAAGDSLLVEFDSPIDAVACAVELQSGMTDHDIGPSPDQWVTFRFGIEIGEVTAGGDDLVSRAVAALPTDTLAILIKPGTVLYGYTGNIATRLAALAEPAGICISGAVRDAIRDQLPYVFEDIGRRNLDIRAPPVHCYVMSAVSLASRPHLAGQNSQSRHVRLRSAAVAVSVFATAGVWGVVLWTWLGATAPRTPTPAVVAIGSHPALVGNTANGVALAGSMLQIPPVSNTVGDGDARVLLSRPTLFDIGAGVSDVGPAPALQPAPDSGTAAVSPAQAPLVLQTTPDDGRAAYRSTGTYWSQLLRSKSEWHQTRRRSTEPVRSAAEALSPQ